MKKPLINKLKKFAEKLPPSVTVINKPTYKKGSELTRSQKKTLEDKGLWYGPENDYIVKSYYFRPIDHFNRAKSAYKRNKEQGLIEYIIWLDRNSRIVNNLYEQLEMKERLERIDQRLLKVAELGAKNFWKNLIIFLTSFAAAFIKEEKLNK